MLFLQKECHLNRYPENIRCGIMTRAAALGTAGAGKIACDTQFYVAFRLTSVFYISELVPPLFRTVISHPTEKSPIKTSGHL